jgi:hypothetical protein
MLIRGIGGDVHQAGGDVLAEQGALGTAQHLVAVEVVEHAGQVLGIGVDHAVHHHAYRGVEPGHVIEGAEAADQQLGGGRRNLKVGVGGVAAQLLEVAHAGLADVVAADGADRSRHLFQGLVGLLRGDHDLLELLGAAILGHSRHSHAEGHAGNQEYATDAANTDAAMMIHALLHSLHTSSTSI